MKHLPHGRQQGFSLIELMIGMALGLLCTMVIATVLSSAEGNRRGTTSGSDALINGNLALFTLQSEMSMAGYGFASEAPAVGCQLVAQRAGLPENRLPPFLAPVFISPGLPNVGNTVRVVASSKFIDADPDPLRRSSIGFTVPHRLIAPHYKVGDQQLPVGSTLAYSAGDLAVLVVNNGLPCELFQISAAPGVQSLPRVNDGVWNGPNFPTQASQEPCSVQASCPGKPINETGSFVVNLGRLVDRTYSIDANQQLVVSELDTITMTRTTRVVQTGVVQMLAYYGHDTNADGAVDLYNQVTPVNQDQWRNVLSARIVIVARSQQYEKEAVTAGNLLWRVGTSAVTAGSVACGTSQCIEINLSALPDWQNYRYRAFDTVVPLRNQRMKSQVPKES